MEYIAEISSLKEFDRLLIKGKPFYYNKYLFIPTDITGKMVTFRMERIARSTMLTLAPTIHDWWQVQYMMGTNKALINGTDIMCSFTHFGIPVDILDMRDVKPKMKYRIKELLQNDSAEEEFDFLGFVQDGTSARNVDCLDRDMRSKWYGRSKGRIMCVSECPTTADCTSLDSAILRLVTYDPFFTDSMLRKFYFEDILDEEAVLNYVKQKPFYKEYLVELRLARFYQEQSIKLVEKNERIELDFSRSILKFYKENPEAKSVCCIDLDLSATSTNLSKLIDKIQKGEFLDLFSGIAQATYKKKLIWDRKEAESRLLPQHKKKGGKAA